MDLPECKTRRDGVTEYTSEQKLLRACYSATGCRHCALCDRVCIDLGYHYGPNQRFCVIRDKQVKRSNCNEILGTAIS